MAAEAWIEDYREDDLASDDARVKLGTVLKQHTVFRELITGAKGKYQ